MEDIESARQAARQQLELLAETERLKYVTPGSGKAMAYQQQKRELDLWLDGERRAGLLPVATKVAIASNQTTQQVINTWHNNIAYWVEIGSAIEANLVRMKLELAALNATEQADFDNFLAQANFYQVLL
jgi:hypothetical protein